MAANHIINGGQTLIVDGKQVIDCGDTICNLDTSNCLDVAFAGIQNCSGLNDCQGELNGKTFSLIWNGTLWGHVTVNGFSITVQCVGTKIVVLVSASGGSPCFSNVLGFDEAGTLPQVVNNANFCLPAEPQGQFGTATVSVGNCPTICDLDTGSDIFATFTNIGNCGVCVEACGTRFNGNKYQCVWSGSDWHFEAGGSLVSLGCNGGNVRVVAQDVSVGVAFCFIGESPAAAFTQVIDNDLLVCDVNPGIPQCGINGEVTLSLT